MNFAFIPNVPLFLKGCGKGEAFYDAPINLGLQPIKLLAEIASVGAVHLDPFPKQAVV